MVQEWARKEAFVSDGSSDKPMDEAWGEGSGDAAHEVEAR